MKNSIKYILQRTLGFRSYLYFFAKYKIKTLKNDAKENEFFTFLGLLEDGKGNVLDIGANLGIMTVHLAQKLPTSTVIAIEPMPDNRSILKKIIAKFHLKNVVLHEVALGETEGTVKMILPTKAGAKMQGLSHVKHESITEWNEGEEFEVPMKTLDNLCSSETAIQGIKMDVENFEYFVLKGGQTIIEKFHPIIYTELWDNENRQKCFEFLTKLGYSVNVASQNNLVPFNSEIHLTQNFIFTRN